MLQPGQQAPAHIYLQDSNGNSVNLMHKRGKYVVLYFYPRDNTPGCTLEAQSFRDYHSSFEDLGVEVIGVSRDSVESHAKFRLNQGLRFELWSDPDLELIKAFDVWQEKVIRSTFVIDPEGVIIQVWEKVTPNNHAKEVLDYLGTVIK